MEGRGDGGTEAARALLKKSRALSVERFPSVTAKVRGEWKKERGRGSESAQREQRADDLFPMFHLSRSRWEGLLSE